MDFEKDSGQVIGRSCCGNCIVLMLMSSMNLCHNTCAGICAVDGSGLSEELQEYCVLGMHVQVAGAVHFLPQKSS